MGTEEKTVSRCVCPVCGKLTLEATLIEESDSTHGLWYFCRCGSTFQRDTTEHKPPVFKAIPYTKAIHGVRTYANVFEEMTLGRKLYEKCGFDQMIFMESRGWVSSNEDVDLILVENTLEYIENPKVFLNEAYDKLNSFGILYIDTPNTDATYKISTPYFEHWNAKNSTILWSESALVNYLKKIGFDVIMSRRNDSVRFAKSNTIQIIAQKTKY